MDIPQVVDWIRFNVFICAAYVRSLFRFTGNNEDQLRREIAVIEELLSEQPNSKCVKNPIS